MELLAKDYDATHINYFSIIPPELVQLILSSNEIWLIFEVAFPAFARYCRENKLSYYNQFIKKITYPKHIIDKPELETIEIKKNSDYVRIFQYNNRSIFNKYITVSKYFNNCSCYYCHLRNMEDKNLSHFFKTSNIPNNFQNETIVWMFESKIHRDHAPAIQSTGYECYMRMDMKHRLLAPAEINRTYGIEDYYKNGILCDDVYNKKDDHIISKNDYFKDYYNRESSYTICDNLIHSNNVKKEDIEEKKIAEETDYDEFEKIMMKNHLDDYFIDEPDYQLKEMIKKDNLIACDEFTYSIFEEPILKIFYS